MLLSDTVIVHSHLFSSDVHARLHFAQADCDVPVLSSTPDDIKWVIEQGRKHD